MMPLLLVGCMVPVPTRQPLPKETGMSAAHCTDSSVDTAQGSDFVSRGEEVLVTRLTSADEAVSPLVPNGPYVKMSQGLDCHWLQEASKAGY